MPGCWDRNETLSWASWNPSVSSKLPQSLGPFSTINLNDCADPQGGRHFQGNKKACRALPGLGLQGAGALAHLLPSYP